MDIMEWKPFREVSKLRNEMDRLWDDYFGSGRKGLRPMEGAWIPSVDIVETADKIVVKAEIPGIESKDIDISLSGEVLTIRGEKKTEREEKDENYHLVERGYGSFSRSLRLPVGVDADKIEASYKQGVLTISCPKKEEVKGKTIEIKAE